MKYILNTISLLTLALVCFIIFQNNTLIEQNSTLIKLINSKDFSKETNFTDSKMIEPIVAQKTIEDNKLSNEQLQNISNILDNNIITPKINSIQSPSDLFINSLH